MSILKAFLYTIGLVVIWSISQLLFLLPLKYYFLIESLSPFVSHTIGIISSLVAYLSVFYLLDISRVVEKQLFKFKPLHKKIIFALPLITIGMYLFDRLLWDLFNGLLCDANPGKNNFKPLNYLDFNIYPQLLSAIIISPIFEELFFRKFLFAQLLKNYSLKIALIISSLCFSLIHIETPHNLFATFFGGVVLGSIFNKTNNISYSIIIHMLFNCIAMLLGQKLANYYLFLNYNMWYYILAFIGLILIYLSFKWLNLVKT